jgi:hypothetical protein
LFKETIDEGCGFLSHETVDLGLQFAFGDPGSEENTGGQDADQEHGDEGNEGIEGKCGGIITVSVEAPSSADAAGKCAEKVEHVRVELGVVGGGDVCICYDMTKETERVVNRPKGSSGRTLWIFALLMLVCALFVIREGCARSGVEKVDLPTALGNADYFPYEEVLDPTIPGPSHPIQRYRGLELYASETDLVEHPESRMLQIGNTDDGLYALYYYHREGVWNSPPAEMIAKGPWYFKIAPHEEVAGRAYFLEVGTENGEIDG